MKVRTGKLKTLMPKAVSAVLAFWMSSVLVLACCGSHLSFVSADELSESPSCPMGSKGHDCCPKQSDGQTSVSESDGDMADCCIFKPTRTLSADLQTAKILKQSSEIAEKVDFPKPVFIPATSAVQPAEYLSVVRDRGSTYLKNCVFRI
jgi:hypothetical protein